MANFNTNQTRQLYVAKAFTENAVTNNGDIAFGQTETDEMFLTYKNGDGLVTRSDLIIPKNVVSLKKTASADMAIPLMDYTVTIDTGAVTLANLVGKDVNLVVNIHQVISYDSSDMIPVVANVTCTAANTASAGAFYKAVAKALVNAIPPKFASVPFKVFLGNTEITKKMPDASIPTNASALVIEQAAQNWRRGLMSKEPFQLSVTTSVRGSNIDDVAWATVTESKSANVISGSYALADLEYFALGERGDIYRDSFWPNNIEHTYLIDPEQNYDVISIEYFWQGSAENVQKSPRMIQIACEVSGSGSQATSDADDIYDAIAAAIAGVASS